MHPNLSDPAHAGLGELFHAASRRLRRGWYDRLAPHGLSPHQFRALASIARGAEDEGAVEGMRLKDLADRLHIAPRSATEVVDHLQDLGLVERRPDPSDRRAVRIVPTAAGTERIGEVRAAWHRQADDFFSVLDEPEREELERLLRRLVGESRVEDR